MKVTKRQTILAAVIGTCAWTLRIGRSRSRQRLFQSLADDVGSCM